MTRQLIELGRYLRSPSTISYSAYRLSIASSSIRIKIQMSNLLSTKTGGYPEDCGCYPQSAKFETETKLEKLMGADGVVAEAEKALDGGATRFCMGAASIFVGTKLLTTPNPGRNRDAALFSHLGLTRNYHSSSDFDDALE